MKEFESFGDGNGKEDEQLDNNEQLHDLSQFESSDSTDQVNEKRVRLILTDGGNVSLDMNGIYKPEELVNDAKLIFKKMKKDKISNDKIQDMLAKVCMIFGLPTSIASNTENSEAILDVSDESAKLYSKAINQTDEEDE